MLFEKHLILWYEYDGGFLCCMIVYVSISNFGDQIGLNSCS